MKKVLISIPIFLLLSALVWDQNRSVYCLDGRGPCITVWKRLGGECYILPGKHYLPWLPSSNYVNLPNRTYSVDVFFVDKDSIFFSTTHKMEVYSNPEDAPVLKVLPKPEWRIDSITGENIFEHEKYNQSYEERIGLVIDEGWAVDSKGKKLK